ncbi:MAG: hypothetical protein R2724_17595 [Bryobacterales bacterium]
MRTRPATPAVDAAGGRLASLRGSFYAGVEDRICITDFIEARSFPFHQAFSYACLRCCGDCTPAAPCFFAALTMICTSLFPTRAPVVEILQPAVGVQRVLPADESNRSPELDDMHRRIWSGELHLGDNPAKTLYGRAHWRWLRQATGHG